MNKLITAADIQKAITSIAGRGAKLDGDIQKTGLAVLSHVDAHGDTTLADKLVQAMPKGGRKLALVEWMLAYGKVIKLDKSADKDAVAMGRLFKHDATKKTDIQGATDTPWTEFKREADVLTAFDAQAAVQGLFKRITKAKQDGLTITNKEQALKDAQAVVAALS